MTWRPEWKMEEVPGIGLAWISIDLSSSSMSKMEKAFDQAWAELCQSQPWRDWYSEHYLDVLPSQNVLSFGDYKLKARYVGRGEMVDGYISARSIIDAPDMVAALKAVIVKFYEKRASHTGLPLPPRIAAGSA